MAISQRELDRRLPRLDDPDQFGTKGNGSPDGVDARLVAIVTETAKRFPLRSRILSGARGRGSGAHRRGLALDITIYCQKGYALPNYQDSGTRFFRIYELFAQAAWLVGSLSHPDLFDGRGPQFEWGGLYGDAAGGSVSVTLRHEQTGARMNLKYGSADFMHYHIETRGEVTRAGDINSGLSRAYKGFYDAHDLRGGSRAYSDAVFDSGIAGLRTFALTRAQADARKFYHVARASGKLGPRAGGRERATAESAFESLDEEDLKVDDLELPGEDLPEDPCAIDEPEQPAGSVPVA